MIQLNIKLYKIDYDVMLSKIQDSDQSPKSEMAGCLSGLIKITGKAGLLTNHRVLKLFRTTIKKSVTNLAEGYGVYLAELEIEGVTIIHENRGGGNMLNISVSLESIDWDKLMAALVKPAKKTKSNDNTLQEIVRIIKPFIGRTMGTVPPSAIAELFGLLAEDKVIKLAKNYGLGISVVSVKPG